MRSVFICADTTALPVTQKLVEALSNGGIVCHGDWEDEHWRKQYLPTVQIIILIIPASPVAYSQGQELARHARENDKPLIELSEKALSNNVSRNKILGEILRLFSALEEAGNNFSIWSRGDSFLPPPILKSSLNDSFANAAAGLILLGAGAAAASVACSIFSGIGSTIFKVFRREYSKSNVSSELKNVHSSVYAPSEISIGSYMLIQVFLHSGENVSSIDINASEAQENAKKRSGATLSSLIKAGEDIDVLVRITGGKLLFFDVKRVKWNGKFAKCTFSYLVPKRISTNDLLCEAILICGNIPVGEMIFTTKVSREPKMDSPMLRTRLYRKIFISYSHKDESRVSFMSHAYKAQGADCFFDRDYLKGGDIFPEEIQTFINNADLFILCWSKNAAESDYVKQELAHALKLSYPMLNQENELNWQSIR